MVKVTGWNFNAGHPLPQSPNLADDRGRFPDAVVRELLAYLEKHKQMYQFMGPTPIQIVMGPLNSNAEIVYGVTSVVKPGYGGYVFRAATVEFLFRERRKGPILAKYRYLAARTPDHRDIVGPQLEVLSGDRLIQRV
jgi:hypothetical protein